MKNARHLVSALALVCALAMPSTGHARTVYDAGAALRANCTAETGAYANPYTDENGGVWGYYIGNLALTTTSTLNSGTFSWGGNPLAGFAVDNGKQATSVRVYNSDTAKKLSNGETLQPSELILFPGNSDNQNACVRFTAPSAGWYSAFVSAHDLAKENSASVNSGTMVTVMAQGNTLVQQIVSCEQYASASSTLRFDFQMPVRYLAAGDAITVFVGRNGVNSSDNTGVTFIVTKEDEGAFYDSGIAMTNNLATRYENPYGSIAHGTWYYLVATTAGGMTAPENVSHTATSRYSTKATRAKANNQRGFADDEEGSAPYILVNEAEKVYSSIAPCELHVHPSSVYAKWPVIRFRPPESGYYTASVVARDVSRGDDQYNANGVDVYLYVADTLVTNAYVSLESFASTAHLTFDSRLMAAGEPIDIVVSPSGNYQSDATAISAIVRREDGDVYDANKSFYDYHKADGSAHPFPDAIGGGATWDIGAKTNVAVATQFYSLPSYGLLSGNSMGWWLHGASAAFAARPFLAMANDGIAGGDSYIGAANGLLAVGPQEFLANPNTPGYRSSSPTLRASVPSDGIYRARGNARDLNNDKGNDGVRFGIAAGGAFVPATAIVFRENGSSELWEGILDSDRLWLKAGEKIDFVIEPNQGNTGDLTGLSACYVRTGDAPSSRVINVDIGGAATGRLSSFSGRGREGWSDWTAWNALRTGTAASATVENCREADGTTPRNVTLALSRAVSAASGSSGCAMLDTGTADSCTFTVSKLTPNAAYTLYLYGTGDAAFTVGDETKSLDGLWFRADYEPCFARFTATADANGEIAGTFAASATGDAFSGLSIVGEFPEYVPGAFVLVLR